MYLGLRYIIMKKEGGPTNMKKSAFKIKGIIVVILGLMVMACQGKPKNTVVDQEKAKGQYQKITVEEAKEIMEGSEAFILLDVRTPSEFTEGHINNATLLPLDDILELAAEVLPDKDTIILVYCRSGNRSKTASMQLLGLGYTKVFDFGGIIDWPYETIGE